LYPKGENTMFGENLKYAASKRGGKKRGRKHGGKK
jgi:hypothetical protein